VKGAGFLSDFRKSEFSAAQKKTRTLETRKGAAPGIFCILLGF
jgi:hypothetical protein